MSHVRPALHTLWSVRGTCFRLTDMGIYCANVCCIQITGGKHFVSRSKDGGYLGQTTFMLLVPVWIAVKGLVNRSIH